MVQGIVKAKYDVVEPAIKEVARKYNTSEAKVIEALEVILGREIEQQRKKKEQQFATLHKLPLKTKTITSNFLCYYLKLVEEILQGVLTRMSHKGCFS